MKSFSRQRRNILTEECIAIREERSLLLLNDVKHHGDVVRTLVNEKKFLAEEVPNSRNSRIIAKDSSCVLPVILRKHPAFGNGV